MSFGPIADGGNSRPAPYPPPLGDGGCGGGVGQFSASPIPGPCGPCGPCGPGGPGGPDDGPGGNSGQVCQSLDLQQSDFYLFVVLSIHCFKNFLRSLQFLLIILFLYVFIIWWYTCNLLIWYKYNVHHKRQHFTFLDNMTTGFLSSLAGANGEKVADMPTWRGQTLPMEEVLVLVVPNRVRSANSLLNQAGVSTATNAGMSTSPDWVTHNLQTNPAASLKKLAGANMATSADISTSLVLTRLALAVVAVAAVAAVALVAVARAQRAVERAVGRAGLVLEDLEDLGVDLDLDFPVPTTDTRITAVDAADVVDVVDVAVQMETSPVSSLPSMVGASTRTLVSMLTLLRTFRQSRTRHLHRLKGNWLQQTKKLLLLPLSLLLECWKLNPSVCCSQQMRSLQFLPYHHRMHLSCWSQSQQSMRLLEIHQTILCLLFRKVMSPKGRSTERIWKDLRALGS